MATYKKRIKMLPHATQQEKESNRGIMNSLLPSGVIHHFSKELKKQRKVEKNQLPSPSTSFATPRRGGDRVCITTKCSTRSLFTSVSSAYKLRSPNSLPMQERITRTTSNNQCIQHLLQGSPLPL